MIHCVHKALRIYAVEGLVSFDCYTLLQITKAVWPFRPYRSPCLRRTALRNCSVR